MRIFGYVFGERAQSAPVSVPAALKREPSRRRIEPPPIAERAPVAKHRFGPRVVLPAKRSFSVNGDGFDAGEFNRFTESWNATPLSADEIIRKKQKTLVARSREQANGNDYAKKFLALVVRNVVGPSGIRLNARARDDDGSLDTVANAAIEDAWKRWGTKPAGEISNCDVTGRQSFVDICKLAMRTVAKDGEAICVVVEGADAGPWGFGLQLIDPQRLDVDYNEELTGGDFVRFGIKFNKFGRPLGYFFRDVEASNSNAPGGVSVRHREMRYVDAANVLHLFIPEIVEQKRGLPWMSTALMRMKMFSGMEDAALTAARVGAAKMNYLRPTDQFDDEEFSLEDHAEIPLDAEAGANVLLPRGLEVSDNGVNYPNGEFSSFAKTSLRGIACGLDVSYNALANDLEGVNYSSIQHGLQDERDLWKSLQMWFIAEFCQPIYKRWLRHSLLSQQIVITPSGKPLRAILIDKYSVVEWQPRRWNWVDPEKDVKASGDSVDRKFKSRGDVVREQGADPDTVDAEIAAENERDDALSVERIVKLQELCKAANKADKELNLHWSQVALLPKAGTAPGAFLDAIAGMKDGGKEEGEGKDAKKPAASPAK